MEISPDARMGLVELSVSDLDRSLAYWQAAVGLRVLSRDNGTAELGVDTPLVRFVEEPGARPRTVSPVSSTLRCSCRTVRASGAFWPTRRVSGFRSRVSRTTT